ncbi:replicative DNA helicase [bacterium]|nr:replicative DNA helicase [bacterium]
MVEAAFDSRTTLPANLEAERALLGCLILDNRLIDVALDQMPPAAVAQAREAGRPRRRGEPDEPLFFSPAHQTIFSAILEIYEANAAIDLTTLAEKLLLKGQLEAVGGAPFLAALEEDIFAPGQAAEYARIIVEKWRLRRLIRAAQTIADQASGAGAEDVTSMIESAEQRIFAIGQDQRSADFVHVGEVVADKLMEIEERSKSGGALPGLETGFDRLDQMTGGLRPSNMIIIAARPSMGKTAFAMNIAAHVALRRKKPVGLFSLEMSRGEVTSRLLCSESHVSMGRVLSGKALKRSELDALHEAGARIDAAPLHIDDASTLSALEMRARARRLKSRCPDLALIIVDYLQLMHGGGMRYDNRQQEVTEISRSIKALARELEIPIIALSQLSRQSEQRRGTKDKMPKLSDLRESGAIEQDADVVMFIHRERNLVQGDGPVQPDMACVRIGKQRNGPVGDFDMLFHGEFTQFVTLAPGG